jgi:hypothetical protein
MFRVVNSINERRKRSRKVFYSGACLLFDGLPPLWVRTYDISAEGLCVNSSHNLKYRGVCRVRFSLFFDIHKIKNFEIKANITYCAFRSGDGFKIGLKFIKPSKVDTDSIDDFVKLK